MSWAGTRRGRTAAFLGVYVCGYVLFHGVRGALSPGWFRDAFPSVLVTPVMFSVVDLVPGIRFYKLRTKILVFTCTTAVAAAWFEGMVPTFYSRAVGDVGDVAGMFVGLGVWLVQHFVTARGMAMLHCRPPE